MLRAVATLELVVGVADRRKTALVAPLAFALSGLLVVACDGASEVPPPPSKTASKPKPKPPVKVEPTPKPEPEPEPAAPPRPKTLPLEQALAKAPELHAEHRKTMFCGCRYATSGRVSPASCGYKTRADEKLARYVQWGHIVPPKDFGGARECWTKPLCTDGEGNKFRGIECCQQVDPEFAAMRADLHNIVPFVGEVATDKSNYAFGDVEGEPRLYGSCDLEIDREGGRVEPPPQARGDVARVYFYMSEAYPGALPLTLQQLAQLKGWAAEDPPDEWEVARARAVGAIQGSTPAWVDPPADAPTPAADAEGVSVAEGVPVAEGGPAAAPPTQPAPALSPGVVPVAKPAVPVAKPAEPVAKPAEPAEPVAKPAEPVAKPAEPGAKPAEPGAKPAAQPAAQ